MVRLSFWTENVALPGLCSHSVFSFRICFSSQCVSLGNLKYMFPISRHEEEEISFLGFFPGLFICCLGNR